MNGLYLNIGCGERKLPGFVNIDLGPGADLQWDVIRGLPFPAGTVHGIYSEHFIEHLSPCEGIGFLRECRRVLAREGVVRIATPDLDHIVEKFERGWRDQAWIDDFGYPWLENRGEMLNLVLREWGHRWVYNQEELERVAGAAGLLVQGRRALGESPVVAMRGLEWRKDSLLILELGREPVRAIGETGLVSVLIPAYKPQYFEAALRSALDQSYSHLEVLVCDDSGDATIEHITLEAARTDRRVRYERNAAPLGSYSNHLRCFALSRGEFIKFLCDDDLLAPECVEKMVGAFGAFPDVSLVTSYRRRVTGSGQAMPDAMETAPLASDNIWISGDSLADRLLRDRMNIVGEPTTVLFRRRDVAHVRPNLLSFGGRPVRWNVDVAIWLNLLGRGNAIYLAEPLSFFRQHEAQETRLPDAEERARAAWDQMTEDASRLDLWRGDGGVAWNCHPLSDEPLGALEYSAPGEALRARALELGEMGRYAESAEVFRVLVAMHPDSAQAHLSLGLCLYALEKFIPAIEALARAIELDPSLPQPVRELAELLGRRVAGLGAEVGAGV